MAGAVTRADTGAAVAGARIVAALRFPTCAQPASVESAALVADAAGAARTALEVLGAFAEPACVEVRVTAPAGSGLRDTVLFVEDAFLVPRPQIPDTARFAVALNPA